MRQQAVVLEDGEGHLIGYCSVHRRNARTQMQPGIALEAFGFVCTPTTVTGFGQDLLWRDRGLPLPTPLPLDVYVPPQPLAPAIRAGRNEPCPCGSGLKFKKRCGSR